MLSYQLMESLGSEQPEMLTKVMKGIETITEGHLEGFLILRQSILMCLQSVPLDSLFLEQERLLLLLI